MYTITITQNTSVITVKLEYGSFKIVSNNQTRRFSIGQFFLNTLNLYANRITVCLYANHDQ